MHIVCKLHAPYQFCFKSHTLRHRAPLLIPNDQNTNNVPLLQSINEQVCKLHAKTVIPFRSHILKPRYCLLIPTNQNINQKIKKQNKTKQKKKVNYRISV